MLRPKLMLLLVIIVLVAAACVCESYTEVPPCWFYGMSYTEYNTCLDQRQRLCSTIGLNIDPVTGVCITPIDNDGDGAVNDPLAPLYMDCEQLALTSPLDGLPNGEATFYWNSLHNAVSYQINVYNAENNEKLAEFGATIPSTSVMGDVGTNAIGGNFTFTVEIVATGLLGDTCSKSYQLQREANPPQPEDDDDDDDGGGGSEGGSSDGGGSTDGYVPPGE